MGPPPTHTALRALRAGEQVTLVQHGHQKQHRLTRAIHPKCILDPEDVGPAPRSPGPLELMDVAQPLQPPPWQPPLTSHNPQRSMVPQ